MDWWLEHQVSAADISMKLAALGENACPAFDGEQAKQMHWLVDGVADLLKSEAASNARPNHREAGVWAHGHELVRKWDETALSRASLRPGPVR